MRRVAAWGLVAVVAVLAVLLWWQPRVEIRLPSPDGKGELVWRCLPGDDPQARAGIAQAELWPEVHALAAVAATAMDAAMNDVDPSGVQAADAAFKASLSAQARRIDSKHGCHPTRRSP